MKLAITSQGKDLDAALDPRFGRCQYFIIIDTDTGEYIAAANDSLCCRRRGYPECTVSSQSRCRCCASPDGSANATRTLQAGGIKVYAATGGTVRDALGKYKAGSWRQPMKPPLLLTWKAAEHHLSWVRASQVLKR